MKHIGELLQEARFKHKVTVKYLAEKFNVKPVTIYKIESGENFPSIEVLAKYYFLFDIDLNKAMWLIKKESK